MTHLTRPLPLRNALLALIQRHANWRKMRASLLAPHRHRVDPRAMNAHLRRDIGLPDIAPVAPSFQLPMQ